MTIQEDREEFNTSGLFGVIRKLRASAASGYVLLEVDGWQGRIVADRPSFGAGSYLEVRPGYPAMLHKNIDSRDVPTEFKEHV